MDKERAKFYQSGDGSYFYWADDASKWDHLDRVGQLNLLHVLKKEWSSERNAILIVLAYKISINY